MVTLAALMALVTFLVGGYFMGPLIPGIHIAIAIWWYRRVMKENEKDREHRSSHRTHLLPSRHRDFRHLSAGLWSRPPLSDDQ